MVNYDELISKIQFSSQHDQIQSFKKLLDLAAHDQHHFRKYVIRLLTLITSIMPNLTNQAVKLSCLQLLSEIVNVYKPFAPKEQFQFSKIVPCLCDEKIEVRKSSHLMIFNFVKNYQELDQILRSYDEIGRSSDCPWKLTQKILHSFESLMISEPMCVKYTKNYKDVDRFLDFVFEKDSSENVLVKKASSQALTSFVKNKFVPDIIQNLDKNITNKLLDHSKKINYYELEQKVEEIQKNNILQDHVECMSIEIDNPIKKQGSKKQIIKPFFNESLENVTGHFDLSSSKDEHKQEYESNNAMIDQQTQTSKNTLIEELIQKIRSNQSWNTKCQGIVKIYQLLVSHKISNFSGLLVERVLQLSLNIHFKIRLMSLKVLAYMVTESKETLHTFSKKILQIFIDRLCDSKSGIRKLSSDTLKYFISSGKGAEVVNGLLCKMKVSSIIAREEILFLLQQIFEHFNKKIEINKMIVVQELCELLHVDNWSFVLKVIKTIMKIMNIFNIHQLKNILKSQHYEIVSKVIPVNQQQTDHKGSIRLSKQQKYATYQQSEAKNRSNNPKPQKRSEQIQPRSNNFRSYSLLHGDNKLKIIKNKEKNNQTEAAIDKSSKKSQNIRKEQYRANSNEYRLDTYQIPPSKITIDPKSTIDNQSGNKYQNRIYNCELNKDYNQFDHRPKSFSKKTRPHLRIETHFESKNSKILNPQDIVSASQLKLPKANNNQSGNKSSSKHAVEVDAELPLFDYKQILYIRKEDLQPFLKVDKSFKRILINIQNDINWKLQFEALNDLRRLFKFHKNQCKDLVENMPILVNKVLHLIDSPKSSLSKNAMIALSEMCDSLKCQLNPFLELVFSKLLKKGCDTNEFIALEAQQCIDSICQYCSSSFIVPIISQNHSSKLSQIRKLALRVINNLVRKEKIQLYQFLHQNSKIINVLGQYIFDPNEQVRKGSQKLFQYLGNHVDPLELDMLCKKGVSEEGVAKIKKLVGKHIL